MRKFSLFFAFFFASFMWTIVHAQIDVGADISTQLREAGQTAEVHGSYGPPDPREAVASIIKIVLSLLGTVFFVLILMSGYWLITARGEEEKITKAKKTVRSAIIGLAIVLLSYAITTFVTSGITGRQGTGFECNWLNRLYVSERVCP